MNKYYIDGSCNNLTGNGSWAYVNETETDIGSGELINTTNNQAELTSLMMLLLSTDESVNVLCDSTYVIGSISRNWNNVKNVELITAIKNIVKEKKAKGLKIILTRIKSEDNLAHKYAITDSTVEIEL